MVQETSPARRILDAQLGSMSEAGELRPSGSASGSEWAVPAREQQQAPEAVAAEAQSQGARRAYCKWSEEEEQVFFATLRRVAGQKPELCFAEISKQIRSKDYRQARCGLLQSHGGAVSVVGNPG